MTLIYDILLINQVSSVPFLAGLPLFFWTSEYVVVNRKRITVLDGRNSQLLAYGNFSEDSYLSHKGLKLFSTQPQITLKS